MATQPVVPVSARTTAQVASDGQAPPSLSSRPQLWTGMHTGTLRSESADVGWMSQNSFDCEHSPRQQYGWHLPFATHSYPGAQSVGPSHGMPSVLLPDPVHTGCTPASARWT